MPALFKAFLYMGGISFGGGVVAYLRQVLVKDKKWLDDEEFLTGLELCQTLPGLIATNYSLYVGMRLRGLAGALTAFFGMVLPGFCFVMTLGYFYGTHGEVHAVDAMLRGAAAAATGFLLAVTLQIGGKLFRAPRTLLFILVTAAAVSFVKLSLVVVILTIGPLAVWICCEKHDPISREHHE